MVGDPGSSAVSEQLNLLRWQTSPSVRFELQTIFAALAILLFHRSPTSGARSSNVSFYFGSVGTLGFPGGVTGAVRSA